MNSLSNVKVEIPVPIAPVILPTEPKTPAVVCVTNEKEPVINPYAPSNGPLTNPSIGFSNNSTTPV